MPLDKAQKQQYYRLGIDAVRDIDVPKTANQEVVITVLQQATRAAVLAVTLDAEAAYFVRQGILTGVLKRFQEKVSPGMPVPEFEKMIIKLRRRLHKIYKTEAAARAAAASIPTPTPTPTSIPTPILTPKPTPTPRRRSVRPRLVSTPEWRPAPRQPTDPEDYLKKLQNHPEDTYYGQMLRKLFGMRGVDMKNPFPAPQKPAPIPSAEPPKETPKPAATDAGKSQGEKKKAA